MTSEVYMPHFNSLTVSTSIHRMLPLLTHNHWHSRIGLPRQSTPASLKWVQYVVSLRHLKMFVSFPRQATFESWTVPTPNPKTPSEAATAELAVNQRELHTKVYYTLPQLVKICVFGIPLNPSCLQTTWASRLSHPSLQTVLLTLA